MLREGNQSTNLINRLTLNYAVIYQTHQLVVCACVCVGRVMGRQSALTLQSQALSVLLSSAAITPCLLLTSDWSHSAAHSRSGNELRRHTQRWKVATEDEVGGGWQFVGQTHKQRNQIKEHTDKWKEKTYCRVGGDNCTSHLCRTQTAWLSCPPSAPRPLSVHTDRIYTLTLIFFFCINILSFFFFVWLW